MARFASGGRRGARFLRGCSPHEIRFSEIRRRFCVRVRAVQRLRADEWAFALSDAGADPRAAGQALSRHDQLSVDATDLTRAIFRVHETIPVAQSAHLVTLLYPKWLPGNHGPSGPIDKFAGLEIRADGTQLAWKRDTVDVYAFHVACPKA